MLKASVKGCGNIQGTEIIKISTSPAHWNLWSKQKHVLQISKLPLVLFQKQRVRKVGQVEVSHPDMPYTDLFIIKVVIIFYVWSKYCIY